MWKCLIWPLNAEPWKRSGWKNKVHAVLELITHARNFIFLDVELCETKT